MRPTAIRARDPPSVTSHPPRLSRPSVDRPAVDGGRAGERCSRSIRAARMRDREPAGPGDQDAAHAAAATASHRSGRRSGAAPAGRARRQRRQRPRWRQRPSSVLQAHDLRIGSPGAVPQVVVVRCRVRRRSSFELLAQHLHAAVQVDAHRGGRQAGALRDLRPRHALRPAAAPAFRDRPRAASGSMSSRRVGSARAAVASCAARSAGSSTICSRDGGSRWRGCGQSSPAIRRTPPARAVRRAGSRRSGTRPGPGRRRRRAARAPAAGHGSCARSARTGAERRLVAALRRRGPAPASSAACPRVNRSLVIGAARTVAGETCIQRTADPREAKTCRARSGVNAAWSGAAYPNAARSVGGARLQSHVAEGSQ